MPAGGSSWGYWPGWPAGYTGGYGWGYPGAVEFTYETRQRC